MSLRSRKPPSLRLYQSKSSVESYLRCPKLYYYKYVEGLSEGEPDERQLLGTLWHSIQETGKIPGEVSSAHSALLGVLWDAYSSFWKYSSPRVLFREIELEAEYRGVKFKGILDKIVEDDVGLWVVEHKTTQSDISEKSAYWKRLPLDIQVNLYPWLARENGINVKGTLWDVVKIPAYKRLAAASNSEGQFRAKLREQVNRGLENVFKRHWFVHDEANASKSLASVVSAQKLVGLGEFPMNSRACFWRDGQCGFVEKCYG